MKQTTDELKKIIENAPDGSACYCGGIYANSEGILYNKFTKTWDDKFKTEGEFRLLSDIREIIELRERLEEATMYLDSFIVTESKKDHLCEYCYTCSDNQIDFTEVFKALDALKGRN